MLALAVAGIVHNQSLFGHQALGLSLELVAVAAANSFQHLDPPQQLFTLLVERAQSM